MSSPTTSSRSCWLKSVSSSGPNPTEIPSLGVACFTTRLAHRKCRPIGFRADSMASGAKQLLGGLFAATALALLAWPAAAAATLFAHGSVRQVDVVGARPGQRLTLQNARGRTVAVRTA